MSDYENFDDFDDWDVVWEEQAPPLNEPEPEPEPAKFGQLPHSAVWKIMKENSGRHYILSQPAVSSVQRYASKVVKMLTQEAARRARRENVRKITKRHVEQAVSYCRLDLSIHPNYDMMDIQIPTPSPR